MRTDAGLLHSAVAPVGMTRGDAVLSSHGRNRPALLVIPTGAQRSGGTCGSLSVIAKPVLSNMAIISSRLAPTLHRASSRSSARTGYRLRSAGSPKRPRLNGSITRKTSSVNARVSSSPRNLYARSSSNRVAGPNSGCRSKRNPAANSGLPNRWAVSEKLTAAKYSSDTAVNAGKLPMVA